MRLALIESATMACAYAHETGRWDCRDLLMSRNCTKPLAFDQNIILLLDLTIGAQPYFALALELQVVLRSRYSSRPEGPNRRQATKQGAIKN